MAQFLGKCLEICWKMVLQNPDMEFEFPKTGSPFDERRHNRGNISYTNSASIEQVSHPALLHGDLYAVVRQAFLHGSQVVSSHQGKIGRTAGLVGKQGYRGTTGGSHQPMP